MKTDFHGGYGISKKKKSTKHYIDKWKKSDYNDTIGQNQSLQYPNIAEKKGSLFQMANWIDNLCECTWIWRA